MSHYVPYKTMYIITNPCPSETILWKGPWVICNILLILECATMTDAGYGQIRLRQSTLHTLSSQANYRVHFGEKKYHVLKRFGLYVENKRPEVFRDHSVYVPSQWEMALQCNAISHSLGTYTEWSLWLSKSNWITLLVMNVARMPRHYKHQRRIWIYSALNELWRKPDQPGRKT